MFGFLKRRDVTRDAAELAASLSGAVLDYTGWRGEMTVPRLAASGVLTVWAAQVMRAQYPQSSLVGKEALKLMFNHRTPEAEMATQDAAVYFYEKLKLGPLHDSCAHKLALFVIERDPRLLQDLAQDVMPELEAAISGQYDAASEERAEEVRSYRFQKESVREAWEKLRAGKAPDDARRIWQAMPNTVETAHEIAEEAGVSVETFVFWMVVFRDAGLVREYACSLGEPIYHRLSEETSDTDRENVLRILNA